jgi:SAM-dependent methyltransferase
MKHAQHASIEFALQWKSDLAWHTDRLFAPNIDYWRDLFPGMMEEELKSAGDHESASEEFPAGKLVDTYSESLVKQINRSDFNSNFRNQNIIPQAGRFYPKAVVAGVTDFYPEDIRPFRVNKLLEDVDMLEVDFNHPLSHYPITLLGKVINTFEGSEQPGGSCQDVAEIITEKGPGLQARNHDRVAPDLRPPLARMDSKSDALFYTMPRMVKHVDDQAALLIADLYRRFLHPGIQILDFMSSWVSHLPSDIADLGVTGLGMNKEELEANKCLTELIIQDVNANIQLPFEDGQFDLVICSLSVEYLTDPIAVFQQIKRVLKPGGVFINTFSERWFPTKAISLWSEMHPFERIGLVLDYFIDTGFKELQTESIRGYFRPEDDKYRGMSPYSDPVYAVWGQK